MSPKRIFVPGDSAALSVGADTIARRLAEEARRRGAELEIVRTGSRGMLWLEPLVEVETRATTAAEVAQRWAMGRRDLNPEEVAVAALLADTGELLLWVYAPELPEAARDELLSGRARRSSQAQQQACGFDFKLLTMRCAEQWKLPLLVVQLLRGIDTPRANITRICSNSAPPPMP